ncbi:glycosyl transferase family protein [Rhodovulum sp. DZ06]|uniref:glycosyl transferase family protein n=1 Tax=Rhodovulum sp. DZ06 TaxID=3425126 RepID=UPI003D330554
MTPADDAAPRADAAPYDDLSQLVRALGRGPGRSRNLTREEAAQAMTAILAGRAAPEAVGALLMLMRYRGESPEEIAGFVDAMRARSGAWAGVGAALDWPSYAAGKSRGLPWFLLSARLVAQAGFPVMLHGWNSHPGMADPRESLSAAGIPVTRTPDAARDALAGGGLAYAPLECIDAELLGVLRLRERLGLRSAVNTALRAWNPSAADAQVEGVFHPPYRPLARGAAEVLGEMAMTAIKGGGGEFERHPSKTVTLEGLRGGAPFIAEAPALVDESRRLKDGDADPGRLPALWTGAAEDPFAEAVVTGTAALALMTLGVAGTAEEADEAAATLWTARDRAALAA